MSRKNPDIEAFCKMHGEYYDLPTAQYYTPALSNVQGDTVALMEQGFIGMTNHTSKKPVIGAYALNPCAVLILYNKKTKTAILKHRPLISVLEPKTIEQDYRDLLAKVRSNDSEKIELHLIGGSEYDQHVMRLTTELMDSVKNTPNLEVKTFDMFDKPKPVGVALDTRNGNLIRETRLVKNYDEAKQALCETSLFDEAGFDEIDGMDFDGTLPEHQTSQQR